MKGNGESNKKSMGTALNSLHDQSITATENTPI
jgi:hypothetical protein